MPREETVTEPHEPVAEWSTSRLNDHAQMLQESIRHEQERLDVIQSVLDNRAKIDYTYYIGVTVAAVVGVLIIGVVVTLL